MKLNEDRLREVLTNPGKHGIAEFVARMVPDQQPIHIKMDILKIAQIDADINGTGENNPDTKYRELWERIFDYPKDGYQGTYNHKIVCGQCGGDGYLQPHSEEERMEAQIGRHMPCYHCSTTGYCRNTCERCN